MNAPPRRAVSPWRRNEPGGRGRLLLLLLTLNAVGCSPELDAGRAVAPALPHTVSSSSVAVQTSPRMSHDRLSAPTSPMDSSIRGNTVAGMKTLRRLPAEALHRWGLALDSLARSSKRGEAAVASSRIILRALIAPSEQAYHAELARLPVTISMTAGVSGGVTGYYRNYSVNGVVRAKSFVPASASRGVAGPFDEESENALEGEGDGSPVAATTVDYAVDAPRVAPVVDCSATYNSTYYEGECATQGELDEGLATIAALDAEVSGTISEAESSCSTIQSNPSQCGGWETEDELELEEMGSAETFFSAVTLEDGLASAPMSQFAALTCRADAITATGVASTLTGVSRPDCTTQAIDAAVGIVGWGLAKYGAYMVLTSATVPPAGAVAAAVGGSILAAWSLVSGVSGYLTCHYAT